MAADSGVDRADVGAVPEGIILQGEGAGPQGSEGTLVPLKSHLQKILPARRRQQTPVPVVERFRHFRTIGAANNAFLETLGSLSERVQAGLPVQVGTVLAAFESLTGTAEAMTEHLVAMSGGRYRSLRLRLEQLTRELETQVLGLRPIEYGPLIFWPQRDPPLRAEEVGPKAARLDAVARLTRMRVPPFFVVSVYGYRLFLEATGIHDLAAERLMTLDLHDGERAAAVAAELQRAVLEAQVPAALATAMLAAYRALKAEHPSTFGVAVRSSSVVEDSLSSFAGQFESVLNVDEGGLLEAYKRVVSSKFRVGALRYANARGILHQEIAMPVLVMAMVPAEVSGVAYSRDTSGGENALVTAVRGLAQPIVEGRVVPDRIVVARRGPARVVEVMPGTRRAALRCEVGSGLVETVDNSALDQPALSEDDALWVADHAWVLEERFETPQDVEWAMDGEGTVFILQCRPLTLSPPQGAAPPPTITPAPAPILVAVPAAGGVACGPVVRVTAEEELEAVPAGSVLVVPTSSPRLAEVIGRVAAIVAVSGSPTGHMATVAREFGVPCLVGANEGASALHDGEVVTVDGWSGRVFPGTVAALLAATPAVHGREGERDVARETLRQLVNRVAPLTLTDPDAPTFRPANCVTLHDVARFVHQRSMEEMFAIDTLARGERRMTRRLAWKVPAEVLVLDLGGGVVAGAGSLTVEEVLSAPFRALLEGMCDPRLQHTGPVGFDLKGFMSVVVRSAADDQRYGEPSYVLCAADYVHYASRLAYHFATVDALAGDLVNENYARFSFHGGAAVAERREHRASFLAAVLVGHGFSVKHVGDRVDAWLGKRPAEAILAGLTVLGRLMMAARQLDMVMVNRATAESYAKAFLAGDYSFASLRDEPTPRQ
jgi:pyruvate,water dikinase